MGTKRFDTWLNAFTGLGTALRDKFQSTTFGKVSNIKDDTLSALYHQEDMAARICEALPDEALRDGAYLDDDDSKDKEASKFIVKKFKALKVLSLVKSAAIWARVFGGAVLYVGVEDGRTDDQPVDEEHIKKIMFLDLLDKRDITPDEEYTDPTEDKYGEVKTYKINSSSNSADGARIHETRIVRFGGARTAKKQRIRNGGWDDSVLQKVDQVLKYFNVGWQTTSHLLQDASQGVFKIHGLVDMIAGGDKEVLNSRMEVVEMGRSVARSIMVDAELEDFSREQTNFTGLPDVLNAFMLRLAAAARMPVTKLMGQSPSGLNATGESDATMWYNDVETYRKEYLLPNLERIAYLLLLSDEYNGKFTDDVVTMDFPPLAKVSRKEQAETEKLVAEKNKIYIQAGVILAEEVAMSRYSGGKFSADTMIDLKLRKDLLAARDEPIEPEPPADDI